MNYVAFLRAINVGGHGIIRMEKLREVFAGLRFENVRTYIQTGNVLFETPETDVAKLIRIIQEKLKREFNLDIAVLLRTEKDITDLVERNPFKNAGSDVKLYIAFLSKKPDKQTHQILYSYNNENETFSIEGQEVLVTCAKVPTRRQQFSNNLVEKKLGVTATTRNWSVVAKIATLF